MGYGLLETTYMTNLVNFFSKLDFFCNLNNFFKCKNIFNTFKYSGAHNYVSLRDVIWNSQNSMPNSVKKPNKKGKKW